MNSGKEQRSSGVSREKFLTFVRQMTGARSGRADDDHPLPPGPWDPVVRLALERTAVLSLPLPWIRDAIFSGGVHRFGEEVALNPQPLPPRYRFLSAVAEAVASRAELLQEIADATRHEGAQQGIIIVGGYISKFSDEWCGNGFRLKWPFPGPRPSWFTQELQGIDLIVIGSRLGETAQQAFNPELRSHLENASEKFLEAGFSKML